jgi:hypothetical protein
MTSLQRAVTQAEEKGAKDSARSAQGPGIHRQRQEQNSGTAVDGEYIGITCSPTLTAL